jgi:hypothetical protein
MGNQRGTFAKRQREQDRKDKARAKRERLAARRAEVRTTKGPPIAWDEAAPANGAGDNAPASDPSPAAPTDVPADDVPTPGS